MLRKTLLAATALAALSGSALAADLPSRSAPPAYIPPPPVFTWTGFYIGGQIGYGFGTNSVQPFTAAGLLGTPYSYSQNGVVGGAHIGYNYQVAQFVFGLEGDVEGTGISRNLAPFGTVFSNSTSIPIQGSARGRIGFAVDRALFFATGGAAFASIRDSYFGVLIPGGSTSTLSKSRVGWTVGGGIEYALTNNWTIRGEYLYTDYGHYTDFPTSTAFSYNHHLTENKVELGFSYKFDMFAPPAPVLAKY